MQEISKKVDGEVLTLVGPSVSLAVKDPFSAASLKQAVPDLQERTVFVCGPDSLVHAARRGLKAAGVPAENTHYEMVWW
jgi:ferredoxin-NADP reductase